MNKRSSVSLGAIICLSIAIYFIYYLLLRDNQLPFSISMVHFKVNHLIRHWHVLVVGFMPIYVALMFFGAAVFGMYFGGVIQDWISQFLQNK